MTGLSAPAQDFDFSGFVAGETRIFPDKAQFPGQNNSHISPSLVIQPELRYRWNGRDDRITFVPFLRLDADDENRTHVDIRELNWYRQADDWDVVLGVSKVFWGVAESRHLIDIVNQTDLVESPDQEDKLGQPMANLNLLRDWGTLSFFVLPGFRERTFPDDDARLRGALPIDDDPSYESSAEEWHVDFALRYSQTIGDWDFGLAHFYGTSREPQLIPTVDSDGNAFLRQRYDLIHQTSLDAQYTTGPWLLKLEALTRDGHDGDRFFAAVGGFEYTFFGAFESNTDLGLLAEYLHDGRDSGTPATPFEDDIFLGTRLALNDVEDTELLAGVILDLDQEERIFSVEFERRLSDNLNLEIEGQVFDNIDSNDLLSGFEDDSFVEIRLSWFF
ncbi:hypothetical protein HBA54_17495 [Pelagibius litoralis]|uniref:Porin n=1 Tax=Pelagibius litoralis TaxID=374515 RepID=A0A967EZQ3_9PROT|nr:hypothetical protein [Pelagibius litoralis]NIA70402.1 hypothetical protein [Pelagibius litoralis]